MPISFNQTAKYLQSHRAALAIFLLLASLVSVLLIGYHYGSFDQSVHIPFLKSDADPNLYQGDPFIQLKQAQFSCFWKFFVPFAGQPYFEWLLFLVHFLSVVLFFYSVWLLAMTLFNEPLAALFAVIGFIIPHTGFVGFPVIEFSLLSRTFVLPFLLFALNFLLKDQYVPSFLLTGLMVNLNLLMANFMLAAVLVCFMIKFRVIPGKGKIFAPLVFLASAAPTFVWKWQSGTGLDLGLRPEWFNQINSGSLYHVFHLITLKPYLVLTFGGAAAIGLFLISKSSLPQNSITNNLMLVMGTMIGITVSQIMVTHWLPLTLLVQLQVSRASIFVLIIAYVSFAGYLASQWKQSAPQPSWLPLITGLQWLSLTPLVPCLALILKDRLKKIFAHRLVLIGVIILLLAANVTVMTGLGFWQPGIHITPKPSDWLSLMEWVRDHTDKDAVFITPPHMVGIYEPDWRVFAERGSVVSLYDLFEVALTPQYYEEWRTRFDDVAPEARREFNGNFFDNRQVVEAAYRNLTWEQIGQIACKYHADYLVLEKPSALNLKPIYENNEYSLIELNGQIACPLSSD